MIRRDINSLVRDPSGNVSEAKTFVVVFKSVFLCIIWSNASVILGDWLVLLVVVCTYVAPDLLKKMITMRSGVADGGSRTTTFRESTTSSSTKGETK